MSHVTAEVVAPLVARFGPPAEWDGSREITARDAATIRRSTERDRHHDVTFAILGDRGETVVIRKPWFASGAWRIPSGGIRAGETFAAGTIREAMEETGLAIQLTGYPLVARSVFTRRGRPDPWTTHVVTATAVGGTLEPNDTDEIEAARWMPLQVLTGDVAGVLRGTGGALFAYRADLHDEIARLLAR
jgi:ADP-ribose pyrophosphatase YjhB (NUDIX family)